jgi:hypothetical protein
VTFVIGLICSGFLDCDYFPNPGDKDANYRPLQKRMFRHCMAKTNVRAGTVLADRSNSVMIGGTIHRCLLALGISTPPVDRFPIEAPVATKFEGRQLVLFE